MQQNHLVDLIGISPSCLSTFAQPGLGGSAQPGAGTSPKWTLPAAGPQAIVEPDIAAHLLFPLRARVLDGRAYGERADALGGRRLRPRPFGPPWFLGCRGFSSPPFHFRRLGAAPALLAKQGHGGRQRAATAGRCAAQSATWNV